jgi:cation diffusion facilitator family transporter
MRAEKRAVAGNSVVAALLITGGKIVVGVTTGSLGILSEAAHSALDLIAALLTYFSVGVSDKPADADHQYGHGKVENFSAFVETALLLLTCAWVIYEAVLRLFYRHVEVEPSIWAFAVMLVSMAGGVPALLAASPPSTRARPSKPTRCTFPPTSGPRA